MSPESSKGKGMQIKLTRKQTEEFADRVARQLEKMVKDPDGKRIENARLASTVVWNVLVTGLLSIGVETEV